MPGLVRGMAKTAAVVGTAQATRNAVNRRSAKKNAQAYSEAVEEVQPQQDTQPAQAQPTPVQQAIQDPMEELEKLGELHKKGILTDEEFAAKKQELLAKV